MRNDTHFLLTDGLAGVGATDTPRVVRIRQRFPRETEADVAGAVRREIAPFVARVSAGQRIAVTGSSRGIVNLALAMRECVDALKARGAEPFVVPGMGSHGGATAEGQVDVLAANGITEASMGCPIRSSMDVEQVGTTETGFPVYQDRNCMEADGVLVVNRVKPHTGFAERVESGLCKMMVIGLGKQAGASRIHQQSLRVPMGKLILDASKIIVEAERPRLVGGLALVENAYKETAIVAGIALDDHAALVDAEGALLERAYDFLPRLPFDHLDALIVDEMGKNVSGAGMDTNVTGKKPGLATPRIGAIYVRGLTHETHGNAVGIGHADLMPRALVDQLDLNSTYMNAFTAKNLHVGKLPMLMESELMAMQVLLNFRADPDPASLRLAWIRNTSKLDGMWISEALLAEARASDRVDVLGEPEAIGYDDDFNLVPPGAVEAAA